MKFPFYSQYDEMDCGPACLRMVSKYYGRLYAVEKLREYCNITREGVSMLGIREAAERIGYKTIAAKISSKQLLEEGMLPCILYWDKSHFVVLTPQKIKRKKVTIADPANGIVEINKEDFLKNWLVNDSEGIVLFLEPTESFYSEGEDDQDTLSKDGFNFLYQYVKPYRKYIFLLLISMVVGSMLSLIFPVLTQNLVDYGITLKDINVVTLILLSQLAIFVGTIVLDIFRGWLVLHMNSRINITIISHFLLKLMKLQISFFDTRLIGDIKQRIADNNRIQSFLTGSTIALIFSFFNIIVYTTVLLFYSRKILLIFIVFTFLSLIWIKLFLKKRRDLDYKRFQKLSQNENVLYELITGMQEIKLNNSELKRRWNWEKMQLGLFELSLKSLKLNQTQGIGYSFLNQFKNIVISYLSVIEVIDGNITIGMMMSISYIVGQMNSPIGQILGFVQTIQDVKISLERLGEIHNRKNEESISLVSDSNMLQLGKADIQLKNVSFRYGGKSAPAVLDNISVTIPNGKVTAIVGSSGSGKTTLMKLLLQFYECESGAITINDIDLKNVSPSLWRSRCGIVMQEGYIFSDTIANNIAVADTTVDYPKLDHACKISNIKKFVSELPLNYSTKIGNGGNGISVGQKQRILIARAVYKNPDILFLDEATSALDANNEKIIMRNLSEFYIGKTVVVIAHRLSTVKNADQIIVLEDGKIVELGSHDLLVGKKGKYFELVKNQLELGQ